MAENFEPDYLKKMPATDVLQIGMSLLMHQHVPDWPGATDEQLEAVAKGLVGCLASHGYTITRFDLDQAMRDAEDCGIGVTRIALTDFFSTDEPK